MTKKKKGITKQEIAGRVGQKRSLIFLLNNQQSEAQKMCMQLSSRPFLYQGNKQSKQLDGSQVINYLINLIKGPCHKIFCFRLFHESSFPKAIKITIGSIQMFSKNLGYFRKSRCTTGINDTGVNYTAGKCVANN